MDSVILRNTVISVLWLTGVLVLRFVIVRAILRREFLSSESRRRWIVNTRNALLFILFVGLVFIWAQEVRSLALSIVAVAVALVIATKELILCVSGAVLRASVRSFSVGDRIEISDVRGDVIDHSLLATTILEIGPGQTSHQYTGRAIVIPNSVFLTAPLINETFTEDFVLHVFSVPLKTDDDWQAAEAALLDAANAECSSFMEAAREHMQKLEKEHGLDPPSMEPRVSLQLPEPGIINLLVRIPVPARRKGRVEQAILRHFLSNFKNAELTG